jgi:hypothetical protein
MVSGGETMNEGREVAPFRNDVSFFFSFFFYLFLCSGPNCKYVSCDFGTRIRRIFILSGHVFSYLNPLQHLAKIYAYQLHFNERQIRVVRVCADDGTRLVGLIVPKFILDKFLEQVATGQQAVSAGLGVPASEEQPRDADPALVTKYTGRPHTMAAAPSFFGGGKEEELHAPAASIHGDAAAAAPHQSSHLISPHKHSLPSLAVGGSPNRTPSAAAAPSSSNKASGIEVVSARKQTSLASFFTKPKPPVPAPASAAVKREPVAAAAGAASSPDFSLSPEFSRPHPPLHPSAASGASASWRAQSLPVPPLSKSSVFGRGTSADEAIDLISDEEEEAQPARAHPSPSMQRSMSLQPPARAPTLFPVPQSSSAFAAAAPTGIQFDDDDFDVDGSGLEAALAASRAEATNGTHKSVAGGASSSMGASSSAANGRAHDDEDNEDDESPVHDDDDSMPALE